MKFSDQVVWGIVAMMISTVFPVHAAQIIHLSDVHLNTEAQNITYKQDTGTVLWQNTLEKLDELLKQPDKPKFILYTGDIPAHYQCSNQHCYLPGSERAAHNTNIKTVLDDLRNLSQTHKTPLFYAPGNNDGLAGDYWSFSDPHNLPKTPIGLSADPVDPYPALATQSQCNPGIDLPCLLANPHPEFGYYAVQAEPGLRVLALNSIILGHKYYSADGVSQLSAGTEQLKWMAAQLAAAKSMARAEKVWIIMHIPPGLDAYSVNSSECPAHPSPSEAMWAHLPRPNTGDTPNYWQDRFIQLLDQYKDTVTAVFYGHTHMDEVRRIYNSDGTEITQVAFSAPGITPNHDNNPGFKVFHYDAVSTEPTSFITHYRTPANDTWMQYASGDAYGCEIGTTLQACVAAKPLAELHSSMNNIYMVKHGQPGYNTLCGIEVRPGQ